MEQEPHTCPHGLVVVTPGEPCLRCRVAELEAEIAERFSNRCARIEELEAAIRAIKHEAAGNGSFSWIEETAREVLGDDRN